jgi:hypothetical protein
MDEERREVITAKKPRAVHAPPGLTPDERYEWLLRAQSEEGLAPGEYCLTEYPREICSCGLIDIVWKD